MDPADTGGSKLTGYLPGGKKPVEKNESFVDVAAYLQVFSNEENVSLKLTVSNISKGLVGWLYWVLMPL